jgi:WD40 repeat protein
VRYLPYAILTVLTFAACGEDSSSDNDSTGGRSTATGGSSGGTEGLGTGGTGGLGTGGTGGLGTGGTGGAAGGGGAEAATEWVIWIERHTSYQIPYTDLLAHRFTADVSLNGTYDLGGAQRLCGWSPTGDHHLVVGAETRLLDFREVPIEEVEVTATGERSCWWAPSGNQVVIDGSAGVRAVSIEGGVVGTPGSFASDDSYNGLDLRFAPGQDVAAFKRHSTTEETTLSVVDLRSGVGTAQVIATADPPWTWAWSPTDPVIATNQPAFSLIQVEDGVAQPAVALPDTGVLDLQWLPDGEAIVFRTADGLRLIDGAGAGQPIAIPDTLTVSADYRPSPDSRWVGYYLTDQTPGGSLYFATTSGATPETHAIADGVQLGLSSRHAADWTPDGTRFAFVTLTGELFVMDTSGATPGTPTKLADGVECISWSTDGSILAHYGAAGGFYVRHVSEPTEAIEVDTVPSDQQVENMQWSPTTRLGYLLAETGGSTLHVATIGANYVEHRELGGSGGSIQYLWAMPR